MNEEKTFHSISAKQLLLCLLQAYFMSYACIVQFHKPLLREDYTDAMDYLLAQLTELLGAYRFTGVLLFLLCTVFLLYVKRKGKKGNPAWGLAFFFSLCLFFGRSYAETNSWTYCFGSVVNFVKFSAACLGMTWLLGRAMTLLLEAYEGLSAWEGKNRLTEFLLGKRCFLKVFLILLAAWLPVLVISYPGNLCYDVIGQIEQGLGISPYSAHHPLLHTLLVSGCVRLGEGLFHSRDVGLFLYILLQAVLLGSALAGTISWLAGQDFSGKRVSHGLLGMILLIYLFSPMYSNMVSTAIKDIPFMAAVIWYVILLAELLFHRERLKQPLFMGLFLLVSVLMSLLRNNGFYVLFITGLFLCLLWWKETERKQRIRLVLCLFLLPVLLSKGAGFALEKGLDANKGGVAEMLSVPFQQTARYLQLYRGELSLEEKQALEAVLGDVEVIASSYDPDIADPVKRLYYLQDPVSGRELSSYGKVWIRQFFRHPGVYVEAFLAHIYGWFDPQVSNAPRYEAQTELFAAHGLFDQADKVLLAGYRLAERIIPLGFLQNVGVYTWALLMLAGYMRKKNPKAGVLLIPLLVSLLICMASPCFYLHPRYAYPYMFTLPFLYGLAERSR